MSESTSSSSSPAIALSMVPKLAALIFLALWSTGTWGASAGKLGLTLGVLALFDALTLASLRKGSVAVGWSDLSLVLGGLLGPAVLPLYTIAVVGVIALGGNDGPDSRRMLGGPGVERLASSAPTRFAPPGMTPNVASANNANNNGSSPINRPMSPGTMPRPGVPSNGPGPGAMSVPPPSGNNSGLGARPPFASARPAGAPSASPNQRPPTGNPSPTAPTTASKPATITPPTAPPAPTVPTQTAKPSAN